MYYVSYKKWRGSAEEGKMHITVERTEDGFRWNVEDWGDWEAVLEAVDAEARKIDEVAWQAACDKGNAPAALLSVDGWRYCDC